jgi:hypothetical protein
MNAIQSPPSGLSPHSTEVRRDGSVWRLVAVSVLLLGMFAFAGTTLLKRGDSALAPEPARLTVDLYGSTGATGAAVYTYSNVGTTVIKWPGTYTYTTSASIKASVGAPCSTGDIPWGTETRKVIQGAGNYYRCY